MKIEIPNELTISNKSVGSIISISTIIGFISSLFSYFKFDNLDIPYRIIIVLSICLFIAVVDIFFLYLRDRDRQYKLAYIKVLTDLVEKNVSMLLNESSDIKKTVNSFSKDLKKLESNLKLTAKS